MAERKSALTRAPKRPRLEALLAEARNITVTDDELREQRASFVFGNAPRDSDITKESAAKAARRIRLTDVSP
ncbi:hypothetical protein [uncultured Rhodospira sp.]|uniref:hypothetical protein n=1 Tax=uncultured Rhodospira sp. TaxID=1936189 RepID=UPI00262614AB|nr:hypothetical protein [uncultured Rhodospira sp.]